MGANQGMIWKATFPFHLVLSFYVGFDKREYMKWEDGKDQNSLIWVLYFWYLQL